MVVIVVVVAVAVLRQLVQVLTQWSRGAGAQLHVSSPTPAGMGIHTEGALTISDPNIGT